MGIFAALWVSLCPCECFDKIVFSRYCEYFRHSEYFHASVGTFRTGQVVAQHFVDFHGAVFSKYGKDAPYGEYFYETIGIFPVLFFP